MKIALYYIAAAPPPNRQNHGLMAREQKITFGQMRNGRSPSPEGVAFEHEVLE
jgi:hypothetical protein